MLTPQRRRRVRSKGDRSLVVRLRPISSLLHVILTAQFVCSPEGLNQYNANSAAWVSWTRREVGIHLMVLSAGLRVSVCNVVCSSLGPVATQRSMPRKRFTPREIRCRAHPALELRLGT